MRVTVSFELPGELARELEDLAQQTGRRREDLLQEAIKLYLWELKRERLRAELRPLAERAGLATEEEVFEKVS